MPFIQPKVPPLPTNINLTDKTIIITGASAGLGLESARQLLTMKASNLILAVRNTTKGEQCKTSVLADPLIKHNINNPSIKVMKLDMDDYASIQAFAAKVINEVPIVNALLLNAGIGILNYETSTTRHERTTQVNYLSNVLLLLLLFPHLSSSAAKTGSPSRITWLGSRMHAESTLISKAIPPTQSVLAHMDDPKTFSSFLRYADTKLLALLFLYALAPRLLISEGDNNKKKSVVLCNMICPGMVNTGMSDVLPLYLRVPMNVVKAMRGRTVEQGTWLVLNALCVAGEESHGEFLSDKDVMPPIPFIQSAAGQDLQKRLYSETMAEMEKYVTVPQELMAES